MSSRKQMTQRIQKIIGQAGICSRRKAEQLILEKRVFVNQRQAVIGDRADINIDTIKIDNYIIPRKLTHKVILLNKPPGIICSCNDDLGRRTVIDLIPKGIREGMYPVGRLDMYSRGAIIITNNGYLAYQLTHPKYEHKKTYRVLIKGDLSNEILKEWQNGIIIDGKRTKEASVIIKQQYENKSLLEIVIVEGRYRQIRKIAEKLGLRVIDLKRIKISNIELNGLDEGSWRNLNSNEWQHLLK